jgi:hypothetical protein
VLAPDRLSHDQVGVAADEVAGKAVDRNGHQYAVFDSVFLAFDVAGVAQFLADRLAVGLGANPLPASPFAERRAWAQPIAVLATASINSRRLIR